MSRNFRIMVLFPLLLAACGKPTPPPAKIPGAEAALCPTIRADGSAVNCFVSGRDRSVNVVVRSDDDEKARETCATLSGKIGQAAKAYPQLQELKIYAPYRSDKILARCSLNGGTGSIAY